MNLATGSPPSAVELSRTNRAWFWGGLAFVAAAFATTARAQAPAPAPKAAAKIGCMNRDGACG